MVAPPTASVVNVPTEVIAGCAAVVTVPAVVAVAALPPKDVALDNNLEFIAVSNALPAFAALAVAASHHAPTQRRWMVPMERK